MSELKPCPFCGGKAEIWRANESYPKRKAWIACMGGCGVMTNEFDNNEQAAEIWNTRTITRADIPESLVREIQAEGLEKLHGKYGHKTLDGVVIYGEAVLYEAAKIREQKDETV